jgi:hypothetical protein
LQRNFSIKVYQLKVKEALRETDKSVRQRAAKGIAFTCCSQTTIHAATWR